MTRLSAVLLAAALSLYSLPALAQPAAATLHLTVVDPTGAVLANADVTIAGSDEANKSVRREETTDASGVAAVAGLPPGRYVIESTFPGFETRQLKDVRLRSGDNKQLLMLPLSKMETSVEVGQDKQE